MSEKRYYWLKLKRDFFKRHDIRILEGMKDGHEVVLFYLKLLCESVDHDGRLRFSEKKAYTPEMLAVITATKEEVVKSALGVLEEFGLIHTEADGTLVMNMASSMVGSGVDNDNANRQRRYRENQRALQNVTPTVTPPLQNVTHAVTKNNESKSKSKSKSKELELELEKDITSPKGDDKTASLTTRFTRPTVEQVKEYCLARENGVDAEAFVDFYDSKGWKVGSSPMKDWKAAVRNWERMDKKKGGPRMSNAQKEVPYMQKEYTKEYLAQQEEKSLATLDELLEE